MKTLITRAGPGTKIICMGNLAQIDALPDRGSSGLTYRPWIASRAGRTAAISCWRVANARAWQTCQRVFVTRNSYHIYSFLRSAYAPEGGF